MEITNPLEKPVSKNEFNGYWIPNHNAKVMKAGIESNKAPFLPNESGIIKAEPVYNASTGYCLPAPRLIPVQFAKMEKGYTSNIVATRTSISNMKNSIKENEKGVFYNFKDETGEIHTSSFFFPEQTENPDSMISAAKEKIAPNADLSQTSIVIASSEPVEYLGTYIAACKTGMTLSVDPETAEEFKSKMMPFLDNELKKHNEKNRDMSSLSNILFEADKRSTELISTLNPNQTQSQKQSKQMDMSFDMF